MATITGKFLMRGDTAANWTSANPILKGREWGLESDTGRLKLGNGSTAWNSLPYFSPHVADGAFVEISGSTLQALAASIDAKFATLYSKQRPIVTQVAHFDLADEHMGAEIDTNRRSSGMRIDIRHSTDWNPPIGSFCYATRRSSQPVIITPASGVTLNGVTEGTAVINPRWGRVCIVKRNANDWMVSGDHDPIVSP